MKRNKFFLISLSLILGLVVTISSCKKDEPDPVVDPPAQAYVGSAACQSCHSAIYDKFIKSGHPYKLNKVTNNAQPALPYTTAIIPTPAGFTWNDISWMIGGYGWKARFVDKDGFIMTANSDTQYNLENGSQVAYHAGDPMGTKKYDCGKCHTTGWVSFADGGVRKDNLPGMDGNFFAGGIHCEECHGQGAVHAFTQVKSDITLNKNSNLCGKCHTRNADNTIAASGGFIQHHEQYDEWLTSGHNNTTNMVGCNTCHDPHASTKYDSQAPGDGVKATCASCHPNKNGSKHSAAALTCIQCHMPKITKTAVKTGYYTADIKTHIFKINTSAMGEMFNAAGTLANPNGDGMSLDYVCYQCHKDASGNGGSASTRTMMQLSAKATNFH